MILNILSYWNLQSSKIVYTLYYKKVKYALKYEEKNWNQIISVKNWILSLISLRITNQISALYSYVLLYCRKKFKENNTVFRMKSWKFYYH